MRAASLAGLVPFALALLAACAPDNRFVKPVATPVAAEAVDAAAQKYEDGYLRIFVSSNLDANGRAMDFGGENDRPALLLISAKFGRGTVASFSADVDPEIPVLLYDVQSGKTLSSVVDNALLSEGLLIDPESLSRSPHLQIYVRGVPADKAKWVTDLLQLATAEPILSVGLNFVPGGGAVAGLSTKLGSMLSDEIKSTNKPWEEKTLLGLRSDEGLAALDGRQFVVLLNPTTIELQAPPELRRCDVKLSPTGLCNANGSAWVPAQAYVRFELDVTDFRSIKDFIGGGVSCEADERTWSEYRALLASGQLARRQTQYERQLLARGDLLLQMRRAQNEMTGPRYTSRLLQFAQQYALLPVPEDAYWKEHFDSRARQLDGCLRATAVRGQSQYAAIWDSATSLFEQAQAYPSWAATLAASGDPEAPVLRGAERELLKLNTLLSINEVRALDLQSLESLVNLQTQLQQMLVPSYRRIAERVADSPEPLEGKLARLNDLSARSACGDCKLVIAQRAEALRLEAQPPVQPQASEPAMPTPAAPEMPAMEPATQPPVGSS